MAKQPKKTPGAAKSPLVMRFAAGAVKHFGLHMYSTAVPAIAEIVSNAWDADASNVWIDVPFGSIDATTVITVKDDGMGMTYDECNENYLIVGRDRRKAEKNDHSPNGRPVMGHKGLGKFAPFGIADIVQVRTVKNGKRTLFEMDYREMVPSEGAAPDEFVKAYYPQTIDADVKTNDANGTTILLRELRLKRAIPESLFRQAMARRFTCIGQGFSVHVNGTTLEPFSVPLDLRIPNAGLNEEDIEGEAIRWWVGFTPTYPAPLKVEATNKPC